MGSRFVDYTQPGSSYEPHFQPHPPPRSDRNRSRSRDRDYYSTDSRSRDRDIYTDSRSKEGDYYSDNRSKEREYYSDSRGIDAPSSRDSLQNGYGNSHQVYYNPGLDDQDIERAPSERAESEFTVRAEQTIVPMKDEETRAASRTASEIYASHRVPPRPNSQVSQYTYRSGPAPSDVVSVKTKTTRGGKLVVETMSAPHPCCPNTKGFCCLMVLLNLSLLLITLGFVVVLQLFNPPFVWYVGLSMLIFGFLVLFGSLIYCIAVCRDVERKRPPPGELYWTHHWTKEVNLPEINYTTSQQKAIADYRDSEYSFKTNPTVASSHQNSSRRY